MVVEERIEEKNVKKQKAGVSILLYYTFKHNNNRKIIFSKCSFSNKSTNNKDVKIVW